MLKNDYNFASYQAEFEHWLLENKYGILSVKSYIGDVDHFLHWSLARIEKTTAKLSTTNKLSTFINFGALRQYFDELSSLESSSTSNRRMAALNSFLQLAEKKEWLKSGILQAFQKLANGYRDLLKTTSGLSQSFEKYLVENGSNKNTIRGYVADINEYLQITSLNKI